MPDAGYSKGDVALLPARVPVFCCLHAFRSSAGLTWPCASQLCAFMQVIEESYGKDDEAAVQRVKEVYRQLELEPLFK